MKKKDIIYWVTMLALMVIPIMIDFVRMDMSTTFFSDASYWLGVIGVQVPVLLLMLVSRTHAKMKEKQENEQYIELKNTIAKGYAAINIKRLSEEFESYVKADDKARKMKAYTNKLNGRKARVDAQITRFDNAVKRCQYKLTARNRAKDRNPITRWILRENKKTALEQKRDLLQSLIDKADEHISFIRIRYVPISTDMIFGEAEKQHADDLDLRAHEGGEIMQLLITKALGIILFSIAATSFVVFDIQGDVVTIVYKGVVKLMQMIMSVYYGNLAGAEFVKGELMNRTRKKVSYLQQFIDKQ